MTTPREAIRQLLPLEICDGHGTGTQPLSCINCARQLGRKEGAEQALRFEPPPPPSAEGLRTLVSKILYELNYDIEGPHTSENDKRRLRWYQEQVKQLEAALGQAEARTPEPGWQPIATAPKDDTMILRPHRIWGAMDVRRITAADAERVSILAENIPWAWINGDYTTAWTETAFLPFWMPVPAQPALPSSPSDGTPEDR
jgi:hypothetical protein